MNENNHTDLKYGITDIESNENIAGLAYFIFFFPLLVAPDSEFAKFHANQSLLFWIALVIGIFIITLFIRSFSILSALFLFSFFMSIIWLRAIMSAFFGKAKELPLIGHFRIIK